jgi:hypothetical protein
MMAFGILRNTMEYEVYDLRTYVLQSLRMLFMLLLIP